MSDYAIDFKALAADGAWEVPPHLDHLIDLCHQDQRAAGGPPSLEAIQLPTAEGLFSDYPRTFRLMGRLAG